MPTLIARVAHTAPGGAYTEIVDPEAIMARLVMRTRSKPYPVTIGSETQYICGCGLSANQPFCDGTHKLTRDEAEGALCWYDADLARKPIDNAFPNIRMPGE